MQTFDPAAPVHLTQSAIARIAFLISEEGNLELKFRVFVTGGGCSGFQYGFAFDASMAEDDTVYTVEKVSVLLDAMSFPYLEGSEVDFVDDLQGARFVVNNPNALTTCGCGASFAV